MSERNSTTMSFLNLGAALFALTLPIIVVMYLLKLKRTRSVISSTTRSAQAESGAFSS